MTCQWVRPLVCHDEPVVSPDNNLAENAIRPIAVGRKSWRFAGASGGGTEASLLLCSQVETARANGSSLSDSLRLLCTQLPSNRSLAADKAVLPWNLDQTRIMLAAPEGGDGTQTGNRFPSPTGPILACSAITFAS